MLLHQLVVLHSLAADTAFILITLILTIFCSRALVMEILIHDTLLKISRYMFRTFFHRCKWISCYLNRLKQVLLFDLVLSNVICWTFQLVFSKSRSKWLGLIWMVWHFLISALASIFVFNITPGINHEWITLHFIGLTRMICDCIFLSFQISDLHIDSLLNFQLVNVYMW